MTVLFGQPQLHLPRKAQWQRDLPFEGTVLVEPGAAVEADAVVAETRAAVVPVVVDLGQAHAIVEPGQVVKAGELLAERKKRFGRGDEIRASVAGTVVRIVGSELLLAPEPATRQLYAQLPGSVAAVRAGWGVDLEGCFGLLRGCRPAGGEAYGKLGEELAIVTEPLTPVRLDAVAGQGARAVIAPSWASPPPAALGPLPSSGTIVPAPARPGLPVFLTEPGMDRPMAAPVAEALQAHLGAQAAIQDRHGAWLAFASESPAAPQCFGAGSWVRLPDGRAGKLVRVAERPRFFPSGVRALAAEIDAGDRTEQAPIDSLEWIA